MPQKNLQLISVRIDPDTIKKIEEFASRRCYWKRNTIINAILTNVMNDFPEKDIYDMVRRSMFTKDQIVAKYEIVKAQIDKQP